jgi:hypothetical protein
VPGPGGNLHDDIHVYDDDNYCHEYNCHDDDDDDYLHNHDDDDDVTSLCHIAGDRDGLNEGLKSLVLWIAHPLAARQEEPVLEIKNQNQDQEQE